MSGSPAELRAAAAELDRAAAALFGVLDTVLMMSGSGSWQGPAAEAFRSERRHEDADLADAAQQYRTAARTLRAEADEIQRERRREHERQRAATDH